MKKVLLSELPSAPTSHGSGDKKVFITNGQIPHITQFAQVTFAPGEIANKHTHSDMYEIFFVENGSAEITVDEKTFMLTKGMCVTVEPGEAHEIRNTGKENILITFFGLAP